MTYRFVNCLHELKQIHLYKKKIVFNMYVEWVTGSQKKLWTAIQKEVNNLDIHVKDS